MDTLQTAVISMGKNFETLKNAILTLNNSIVTQTGQGQVLNGDVAEEKIDGINVMTTPSRDAYSFALQLMDMLFTKDELAGSLLFQSSKSGKAALDAKRVQYLIGLVNKRYGDGWNMKMLVAKANQKCRDTKASH